MTVLRAASDNRLLGPKPQISMPTFDWSRDFLTIAGRATEQVCNDPFLAAMAASFVMGTHGPTGLTMRSLAFQEPSEEIATTKSERALRRTIETNLAYASGRCASADGMLTRKQLDAALSWLACVMGEGWAVRNLKASRHARYATRWRLVRPERISNPDGKPNSDRLYHGLELDASGEITAIYVESWTLGYGGSVKKRTWERVEWFHKDGTANVVHRVGWRLPGMLRGISMFTPMLLLSKQVAGVIEAHVIAKRAQACNPVIYYVVDAKAAAEEHAKQYGGEAADYYVTPHTDFDTLTVLYANIGQGNAVQWTDTKFNGADLTQFLDASYRVLCAAWGLPVEVVLAQMGKASLSSARAGLDQYDRTCQAWQDDAITEVSRPIDESYIAEMVALGEIEPGEAGLPGLFAGRYSRPPKYSTDRLKDAGTMRAWLDCGRSYTAVFAEFGYSFEDEIEERKRDEDFLKAIGVDLSAERQAERIKTEPQAPVSAKQDNQPAGDDDGEGGDDGEGDDDGEGEADENATDDGKSSARAKTARPARETPAVTA